MKVTGTSSEMEVEMDDGKVIKFEGELLVDGFLAYKDTGKQWEPPYNDIALTTDDLQRVIDAVLNDKVNPKFKIYFE